jgi:CRP/FNR family transcriptional regulator, cyclic AMP receptor protein
MERSPSVFERFVRAFTGATQPPKPFGGTAWVVPDTNWRASLSSTEMDNMTLICPPRPYAKGERIYGVGDPADTLFILLEGHVKITLPTPNGERVVAICGPDDFFGESFLTRDQQRHSDAVSIESRVIACPISHEQFVQVAQQVPNVALTFAVALAERNRSLETELQRATMPAEVRLASSMILLARRFGTETAPGIVELKLELRQEDLGSLAGTTRVSATTAMSTWREHGLLEGTRGFYRINVVGLEELIVRLELERLR